MPDPRNGPTSDARPDHEADRETDVARDDAVAGARATGGDPDENAPDPHSTTGTTPSEEFVGRVAGDDGGYEETTGAEARAQEDGN